MGAPQCGRRAVMLLLVQSRPRKVDVQLGTGERAVRAMGLNAVPQNFQQVGLATRRILSSKGEQICTPGSTSCHTHSALMAPPPHDPCCT